MGYSVTLRAGEDGHVSPPVTWAEVGGGGGGGSGGSDSLCVQVRLKKPQALRYKMPVYSTSLENFDYWTEPSSHGTNTPLSGPYLPLF